MPLPSPRRSRRCWAGTSSQRAGMTDRPASPRGRLSCVIHGRVQGVGYRWYVRDHARRLDISGTVRNCADGTVEVHAAAPETTLAAFRVILFSGPLGAEVERLVEMMPSAGSLPSPFVILR